MLFEVIEQVTTKVPCKESINLVVTVFFSRFIRYVYTSRCKKSRRLFSESSHLVTVGCDQSRDINGESFTESICKKPCDKKTTVTCVKNIL